ncbi:MAG: T9SS type A sorting domain-containing protein [Taibaiella sp.]|nr:T9SS type A sorting domain-containing protein [Taibaiella sp.]
MKSTLLLAGLALTITAGAQIHHYLKTECGTEFTLALRSDSTLWATGQNGNGQLGNTDYTDTSVFTAVVPAQKFIDVAAGGLHTIAIAADSTLWSWGLNGNGQLGQGTAGISGAPAQSLPGTHWRVVAAGMAHSLALKNDGTLWVAGYNYNGQLGTGDTTQRLTWTQIGTDNNWKSITAGGVFSMALKNDGSLWAWGYNGDGELGMGNTSPLVSAPAQVGTATDWRSVSGGFQFSVAIKTAGTLWSTGFNGNGNLGRATTGSNDSNFTQIGTATDWKSASAGASFSFAIKNDGTLWGWGYNGSGQLGTGSTAATQPVVQIGTDNDWKYVSCADGVSDGSSVYGLHSAGFHTAATTLCVAGAGYIGQLGDSIYWAPTSGQYTFNCDIAATTLAVEEIATAPFEPIVMPNPVYNTLAVSGITQPCNYRLLDMTGRSLLSGVIAPGAQVDVSTLTTGNYLLQLLHGNGSHSVLRFVKQ